MVPHGGLFAPLRMFGAVSSDPGGALSVGTIAQEGVPDINAAPALHTA